jgi:hypothetical protein
MTMVLSASGFTSISLGMIELLSKFFHGAAYGNLTKQVSCGLFAALR